MTIVTSMAPAAAKPKNPAGIGGQAVAVIIKRAAPFAAICALLMGSAAHATKPMPFPEAITQSYFGLCDASQMNAVEHFDLDSNTQLKLIGCHAYAYNTDMIAYIGFGEEWTLLSVPVQSVDGAWGATHLLANARFDAKTLTLTTQHKGRGAGDCGSAAAYRLDMPSERFVLSKAWSKEDCDGEAFAPNEANRIYPRK